MPSFLRRPKRAAAASSSSSLSPSQRDPEMERKRILAQKRKRTKDKQKRDEEKSKAADDGTAPRSGLSNEKEDAKHSSETKPQSTSSKSTDDESSVDEEDELIPRTQEEKDAALAAKLDKAFNEPIAESLRRRDSDEESEDSEEDEPPPTQEEKDAALAAELDKAFNEPIAEGVRKRHGDDVIGAYAEGDDLDGDMDNEVGFVHPARRKQNLARRRRSSQQSKDDEDPVEGEQAFLSAEMPHAQINEVGKDEPAEKEDETEGGAKPAPPKLQHGDKVAEEVSTDGNAHSALDKVGLASTSVEVPTNIGNAEMPINDDESTRNGCLPDGVKEPIANKSSKASISSATSSSGKSEASVPAFRSREEKSEWVANDNKSRRHHVKFGMAAFGQIVGHLGIDKGAKKSYHRAVDGPATKASNTSGEYQQSSVNDPNPRKRSRDDSKSEVKPARTAHDESKKRPSDQLALDSQLKGVGTGKSPNPRKRSRDNSASDVEPGRTAHDENKKRPSKQLELDSQLEGVGVGEGVCDNTSAEIGELSQSQEASKPEGTRASVSDEADLTSTGAEMTRDIVDTRTGADAEASNVQLALDSHLEGAGIGESVSGNTSAELSQSKEASKPEGARASVSDKADLTSTGAEVPKDIVGTTSGADAEASNLQPPLESHLEGVGIGESVSDNTTAEVSQSKEASKPEGARASVSDEADLTSTEAEMQKNVVGMKTGADAEASNVQPVLESHLKGAGIGEGVSDNTSAELSQSKEGSKLKGDRPYVSVEADLTPTGAEVPRDAVDTKAGADAEASNVQPALESHLEGVGIGKSVYVNTSAAFRRFAKQHRSDVKAKHPAMTQGQISKVLDKMWELFPNSVRDRYVVDKSPQSSNEEASAHGDKSPVSDKADSKSTGEKALRNIVGTSLGANAEASNFDGAGAKDRDDDKPSNAVAEKTSESVIEATSASIDKTSKQFTEISRDGLVARKEEGEGVIRTDPYALAGVVDALTPAEASRDCAAEDENKKCVRAINNEGSCSTAMGANRTSVDIGMSSEESTTSKDIIVEKSSEGAKEIIDADRGEASEEAGRSQGESSVLIQAASEVPTTGQIRESNETKETVSPKPQSEREERDAKRDRSFDMGSATIEAKPKSQDRAGVTLTASKEGERSETGGSTAPDVGEASDGAVGSLGLTDHQKQFSQAQKVADSEADKMGDDGFKDYDYGLDIPVESDTLDEHRGEKKGTFSHEDDLRLMEGFKKHGRKWGLINEQFFNSSQSSDRLRHRWHSTQFQGNVSSPGLVSTNADDVGDDSTETEEDSNDECRDNSRRGGKKRSIDEVSTAASYVSNGIDAKDRQSMPKTSESGSRKADDTPQINPSVEPSADAGKGSIRTSSTTAANDSLTSASAAEAGQSNQDEPRRPETAEPSKAELSVPSTSTENHRDATKKEAQRSRGSSRSTSRGGSKRSLRSVISPHPLPVGRIACPICGRHFDVLDIENHASHCGDASSHASSSAQSARTGSSGAGRSRKNQRRAGATNRASQSRKNAESGPSGPAHVLLSRDQLRTASRKQNNAPAPAPAPLQGKEHAQKKHPHSTAKRKSYPPALTTVAVPNPSAPNSATLYGSNAGKEEAIPTEAWTNDAEGGGSSSGLIQSRSMMPLAGSKSPLRVEKAISASARGEQRSLERKTKKMRKAASAKSPSVADIGDTDTTVALMKADMAVQRAFPSVVEEIQGGVPRRHWLGAGDSLGPASSVLPVSTKPYASVHDAVQFLEALRNASSGSSSCARAGSGEGGPSASRSQSQNSVVFQFLSYIRLARQGQLSTFQLMRNVKSLIYEATSLTCESAGNRRDEDLNRRDATREDLMTKFESFLPSFYGMSNVIITSDAAKQGASGGKQERQVEKSGESKMASDAATVATRTDASQEHSRKRSDKDSRSKPARRSRHDDENARDEPTDRSGDDHAAPAQMQPDTKRQVETGNSHHYDGPQYHHEAPFQNNHGGHSGYYPTPPSAAMPHSHMGYEPHPPPPPRATGYQPSPPTVPVVQALPHAVPPTAAMPQDHALGYQPHPQPPPRAKGYQPLPPKVSGVQTSPIRPSAPAAVMPHSHARGYQPHPPPPPRATGYQQSPPTVQGVQTSPIRPSVPAPRVAQASASNSGSNVGYSDGRADGSPKPAKQPVVINIDDDDDEKPIKTHATSEDSQRRHRPEPHHASKVHAVSKESRKRDRPERQPEKPKNPFTHFCRNVKPRIQEECAALFPQLSQHDLTVQVQKDAQLRWKALGAQERREYEHQSRMDNARYEREMALFRKEGEIPREIIGTAISPSKMTTEEVSARPVVNAATEPVKPKNPFTHFCRSVKPRIQGECAARFPQLSQQELTKKVQKEAQLRWKALGAQERKEYEERSRLDHARYECEMTLHQTSNAMR